MSNLAKQQPDAGGSIEHGGDLAEARALFPDAPAPWIDLSTGINPVPYPLGELPLSAFHRLPSPSELSELEAAARSLYRAPPATGVVAAPGTQALIELLPRLRGTSRVSIVGPTYGEHAHAWAKAGHSVGEVSELDEARPADVVVVVNPNNPDGRVTAAEQLHAVATRVANWGGWLIVDEAFADFDSDMSIVPQMPENVIVLRSFGKTFGLAGVRLGFLAAAADVAGEVRARMGPWAVSGPAISLGRRALSDRIWIEEARLARSLDAERLDGLLTPLLGPPIGGTVLYRTFRSTAAATVFDGFGQAGIWARRFARDPDLLRFGLPGTDAEWQRLEAACTEIRTDSPV
ncbi:threonine-phosphate decarboxylase CobD [Amorphus orientalis]|uniref:threonine-phosphate decarboxylase n=1 Tax=Amorphus orientalis TaxID=649198 RepID=A0AAE3VP65_9HYPH|nr:threonine-phosphate decarboxylase CobD [Amorphus orientalis]MDQ0315692.1 cobalamin biosynthetic protein CobC [Amorphus orientalis]